MSQNDYVISNLNMISRLALLENAHKSRKAIDSLITILRYIAPNNETMSTLSMELNIAEKMFYLYSQKKRESFNGIIINENIPDTCYIEKGSILDLIQVALGKRMKNNQRVLEIKVVTIMHADTIEIIIQDNGSVEKNLVEEDLISIYDAIVNKQKESNISINIKKGVGTKVVVIIPNVC